MQMRKGVFLAGSRIRVSLGVFLVLLGPGITLAQEQTGEDLNVEYERTRKISFRSTTKRALNRWKLEKLAAQDPTRVVAELDRLRTEGQEPADEIGLAIAEVAIRGGYQSRPGIAAGLFLTAASEIYDRSLKQAEQQGPAETTEGGALTELGLQTRAVEGLIDAVERFDARAVHESSMRIPGPLADYELLSKNHTGGWGVDKFRYIGVSTVDRKNRLIEGNRSGLGAPIIAVRRGELPDEPEFDGSIFPIYEYYYPLTAVFELAATENPESKTAVLHLTDPRRTRSFEMGGVEYPLAFDVGAQNLVMLQETTTSHRTGGAVHAGKYLDQIGLLALRPLRTDQIPVVLVHGLYASPHTWLEAFDEVVLDPVLTENYQFFLFGYPTGLPSAYTASLLRNALVETIGRLDPEGTNPLFRQVVLVGHSMGGLLVRLQVGDSGTVMWDAVFSESPDEIELDPQDLELMKGVLIFESLPFVSRVIFFSSPHRGSKQAANIFGKIGASIVQLPENLKQAGQRIVEVGGDSLTGQAEEQGKIVDSIQSMQPDSLLIRSLDQIDVADGVVYHSVIGDKGKGNSPDSSDGFVAYWSSHLEGAASEKIVASAHGTHKNSEGVQEFVRILHRHLEMVESGN